MAATEQPSTPHPSRTMPPPTVRRSSTLPAMLNERATSDTKQDKILFSHSPVRVFKFKPQVPNSQPSSRSDRSRQSEVLEAPLGTLPWAWRPEQPLGFGRCEIDHPQTVPFLKIRDFMQPLHPKTQCWCVDGESKFVLPIRDGSFCRVELPKTTAKDKDKIEEFKTVLAKVLQYESTPCPFKRGFHVDLPPEPETPVKRVPWKVRTVSSTPEVGDGILNQSSSTSHNGSENSKASDKILRETETENMYASTEEADGVIDTVEENSSTFGLLTPEKAPVEPVSIRKLPFENTESHAVTDKLTTRSEVSTEPTGGIPVKSLSPKEDHLQETESVLEVDSSDEYMTARSYSSSMSSLGGVFEGDSNDETSPTSRRPDSGAISTRSIDHLKTPTRSRSRSKTRAITAPPQLMLGHSQPSKALTRIPVSSETSSLASSSESFQSFQNTTSPLPPSPPDSNPASPIIAAHDDDLLTVHRYRGHKRDVSEVTITPDRGSSWDSPLQLNSEDEQQTSEPSTPVLVSDSDQQDGEPQEVLTPPAINLRRQRNLTHQRSLSPLPLAANLYRPSPRASSRHLTASIIQTTWAILNSPPSHLAELLLTVARRIKNGVLRGSFSGTAKSGEPVTLQWEVTQEEVDENPDWGEDDFGVPIQSPIRKGARQRVMTTKDSDGVLDLD